MIDSKLILITLLVKLGIAAALSSALSRSMVFKNLLLSTRRSAGQMLGLLACICVPLTLGVWVRIVVQNFLAADISFEAVILVALLLGTTPAIIAGAFLSIPAMLHREYLTLPFNLLVALIFGTYRAFVSEEDIWSFSPFVDLSIYRWIRRNLMRPRLDRQIILLMLILGMQVIHNWISHLYPRRLFALHTDSWLLVSRHLHLRADGGGDSAENLECDPHRAQAGRAGTAADGCAAGRAAAADQSTFFVQHAELDRFAGALSPGAGT